MILDEVCQAIGQRKTDANLRIHFEELHDDWQDVLSLGVEYSPIVGIENSLAGIVA